MNQKLLTFFLLVGLLAPLAFPLRAQAQASAGPVYVVQEGDSLTSISQAFHTTATRILLINSVSNADVLTPGKRLVIPGFEDLSGTLTRITLGVGDTPSSLMRQSRSDPSAFTRINFLTSPGSIYVGQSLYTLAGEGGNQVRIPVTAGMTDLELAAVNNVNPWLAAENNGLGGRWDLLANDTVYLPTSDTNSGDILPGITSLSFTPAQQGQVTVALADGSADAGLSGSLDGYTLHFFPNAEGKLEALQGIPRLADPGPTDLILTSKDAKGNAFSIQQRMLIYEVNYGYDAPLQVADNFVDPAITAPEQDFLLKTVADAPAEKLWNGAFQYPVKDHDCQPSVYGRLRSYNGSDYTYFHSGIDFCASEETPIYAAADGVVVFAGPLTVRGNATIISHGRGVYTGYWHQSKIDVTVGQQVKAGDTIGMAGATGRVTGPHLHFEVLVGDVQVDPLPWLAGYYP
jgi:murein DD-endopeptidase MepM/ murein hydrolase activator NlpD